MLFLVVLSIALIAALLGIACLSLLDQRDNLRTRCDEWREAYANERQRRLDNERTIADQTRNLVDVCQKNARLEAELRELAQQPVGFFRETRGQA